MVLMLNILFDNLWICLDNIDVIVVVVVNVWIGCYIGGLKGWVNNYCIDGIGIVDVLIDVKLVFGVKGGFGIIGCVVV